MKCDACTNEKCKGCQSYSTQLWNAARLNKISSENYQKAGVLGTGLATIATAATISTISSGLIPATVGAIVYSVGYSLMFIPLMKFYKSEPLNKEELIKDVALGATIGAVTGPFGYGASELVNGASSGITKFGIRTVFSSGAGAASKAVMEGARYIQGGAVTLNSFAKSVGQGAVVGSIGGASSHIASGSNGVVRVITQGTTSAATDAGIQYHEKGSVDLNQTAMTTVGQMTMATTTEFASNIAQRTLTYANKLTGKIIDRDVNSGKISTTEGAKIREHMKTIHEEVPTDLKTQKRFGDIKAHKLFDRTNSKRADQIAFNTDGKDSAARGLAQNINGKYVYLDKTRNHNYKECRETIKGSLPNPLESLKATKLGSLLLKTTQEDNENKTEGNFYSNLQSNIGNFLKAKM